MRKCAILRVDHRTSTREPFALRAMLAMNAGAAFVQGPPQTSVEIDMLSKARIQSLARDPSVAGIAPVMPTMLLKPRGVDPQASAMEAWGIDEVGASNSICDGSGVVVAVLDTGIDKTHPAFAGMTFVEQDFTGEGDGDGNGHGTHCAGTIFGRAVGGKRIGVAQGIQSALIGKVLGAAGGGDSSAIFEAIQWALNSGAKVISMSLGFDFPGMVDQLVNQDGWPAALATSSALEAYRANLRMFDSLMAFAAARAAFDGGAVIVAASGNESMRSNNFEIAVSLPAAASGVIAVGALEKGAQGLGVADFSNTFPQISAPGVDILSAKAGGGLVSFSGTSMATPHVAGVAALWWQSLRNNMIPANSQFVTAKLLGTARANGFAPLVDPSDRGVGIVTAPQ